MELLQQLNYFSSLADKYLQGGTASEIENQIRDLKNKANDKNLYLAVVGEFSSGKSTFINALLRMRLLKDAVMPTTACATFIERDNGFRLIVSFKGNNDLYQASESDYCLLAEYLTVTYRCRPQNILHLIEILTSEQKVARDIGKLHFYVPTRNIPDNVVIVDTPGFDPGDESVGNHFDIAQNVVANIADVALVLMPSEQPFSTSVNNFVDKNLSGYLHRCVFVLTKMDNQHDEITRMEVRNFVYSHLVHDLRIKVPKVFCESAISVLPVVKIPDSKKQDWIFWQNEFIAFESFLWNFLIKQRGIILSEHLHNLSLKLIAKLKDSLRERKQELLKEREFLNASRMEHIKIVTTEIVEIAKHEIAIATNNVVNRIEPIIRQNRKSCQTFADELLTPEKICKLDSELKFAIESKAKDCVNTIFNTSNFTLENETKKDINRIVSSIQLQFKQHYSMFPTLKHEMSEFNIVFSQFNTPSAMLVTTVGLANDVNSRGGNRIIGGVAGGVAAGAIFGGPIGAIIGGLAGLICGGNSSDNLDKAECPRIRTSMRNEIEIYFNSILQDFHNQVNNLKQNLNNDVASYGERHVVQYGKDVEALIKLHENKIRANESHISQLDENIFSLENMECDIKYQLALLKEK